MRHRWFLRTPAARKAAVGSSDDRGGAAGSGGAVSGQQADFVVVANRLPVDLERGDDGSENWKRSPGGLVTALEPMLRSRRGAWVGWPGLADAEAEPFEEDGLQLHPVTLSTDDVENY